MQIDYSMLAFWILQNDLEDSSCLIVVCIHDNTDPEKVSLTKVKGILTPDILLYEVNMN